MYFLQDGFYFQHTWMLWGHFSLSWFRGCSFCRGRTGGCSLFCSHILGGRGDGRRDSRGDGRGDGRRGGARRTRHRSGRNLYFHLLRGRRPLEKEMVTHSSILAWGIPWTEEPDGLPKSSG